MNCSPVFRSSLLILSAAAALFMGSPPASAITPTLVGIPHGAADHSPCTYFDSSGCEDKAVFSTASFDEGGQRWIYASAQNGHILLNEKNLSTGAWMWTPSVQAINMASIDSTATVALGSVFSQAGHPYFNPVNSTSYSHIMYFVFQGQSTPGLAGSVCVSYSNAGINWTTPIWAVDGTPGAVRGRTCGTGAAGLVAAEAIAGFHTSPSTIHLFHMEGNLSVISPLATSGRTLTYYSTASSSNPDILTRVGEITASGMSSVNRPSGTAHRFFLNLEATYDPANGHVYLLRVYGAPYDVNDSTLPCESACPGGLATFPMRGQIYDMLVNGDFTKTLSTTANSWNLLADLGDFYGHATFDTGVCKPYLFPSCVPQSRYLPDMDSLSVHKDPTGLLYRNAQGQALVFAGLWVRKPREQSCHDVWQAGGPPGGTWRDGDLYQFFWPPLGTDPTICP
ncbi:MAG TPA: hypothetical protein VGG20_22340 [Thermoanaerobaculia bacterium]|jgi:hypothetical protein